MLGVMDKRILFVDDEPRVLRAIRRGLQRHTDDWHLAFAESAEQATAEMAAGAYDIVVSDVAMPGIDGVAFLAQVRDQYPDTVRILLSGVAHGEALVRAVPVAHRFLSKPCDLRSLTIELERAFELRSFMSHGAIRTLVGGISTTPLLPLAARELRQALEAPGTSLQDIVAIVGRDPPLLARLLHIVNSAFFAPSRPLHSAGAVVRSLGTSLLHRLLLSSEIFDIIDEQTLPSGFRLDEFQAHALLTGKIASRLVERDQDKALSAGLLHGIGKLVFAGRMPARWGDAYRQARVEQRSLSDVEFAHFGTSYAEVGGYLLGIWGLPRDLVDAVAHHCDPMRSRHSGLNLVAATHLASVLAAQQLGMPAEDFDDELLESLDGARSLDAWRHMSACCAQ